MSPENSRKSVNSDSVSEWINNSTTDFSQYRPFLGVNTIKHRFTDKDGNVTVISSSKDSNIDSDLDTIMYDCRRITIDESALIDDSIGSMEAQMNVPERKSRV